MPDFRVVISSNEDLTTPAWVDPASATRPSRINSVGNQQARYYKTDVGAQVTLTAILDGEQDPSLDAYFNMWCLEYPTGIAAGGPPTHVFTSPFTSSQVFVLHGAGHYTFAVRHEDVNDHPDSAAGGVVIVHIDAEGVEE